MFFREKGRQGLALTGAPAPASRSLGTTGLRVRSLLVFSMFCSLKFSSTFFPSPFHMLAVSCAERREEGSCGLA